MSLIGEKHNKLTIVEDLGMKGQGRPRHFVLCKCDCGDLYECNLGALRRTKYPIKSCGCEQYLSGKNHHAWNGCGEISGNRWDCIKRKRQRAKIKELPFSITIEYAWDLFLKQNRKCAMSGMEINFAATGKDKFTASLDRIDSNEGYVDGNVQWVHKDINWMKNTFSQQHFVDMCKKVADHAMHH